MSDIRERRCVAVPFAVAAPHFERYIHDVVHEGGGKIVLSVIVPIERIGIDRRIETSKVVSVHFAPVSDADACSRRTAITWEPEGGGPFPQFDGVLRLGPGENPDGCCVLLEGAYDPPFGVVGDLFDAVVGRHIARMTVRNLLDEIAIIMETSHAATPVRAAGAS